MEIVIFGEKLSVSHAHACPGGHFTSNGLRLCPIVGGSHRLIRYGLRKARIIVQGGGKCQAMDKLW